MSWPAVSAMGANAGNGPGPAPGGNEMVGQMQGSVPNQPHATEYTLQGRLQLWA